MEKQVTLNTNGQECQQADFNTVAEEAAKSTDWLLAELLRPTTIVTGDPPQKYIVPSGSRREGEFAAVARRVVVGVSGSADAKVRIAPFTAVLSSITGAEGTDIKKSLREIHTQGHYGTNGVGPWTDLQLPATTQRRWDLVYARMDIDTPDAAVTRYVKSGAGVAAANNIVVSKQTKITIGFVQGTEAASDPTLPAAPADSATSYYFKLAYVSRGTGETLTTLILSNSIREIFEPIGISPAVGGSRVQPADGAYLVAGYSTANEVWNTANGRPKTHMPPSMFGKEERFIPIHAFDSGHGNPSCPINATTVVDGSVDWRRRMFKTVACKSTSNDGFPWSAISPPAPGAGAWNDGGLPVGSAMWRGQSWVDDASTLTSGALASGYVVAWFTNATNPAIASTAFIVLFVDVTTGQLKVWRNNVNAACYLLLWVEASAPFLNMNTSGL